MTSRHKSFLLFVVLLFGCGVICGQDKNPLVELFKQQDSVVFRASPQAPVFYLDYKDNAAAVQTLSDIIGRYRASIDSGSVKVRILGYCPFYGSSPENLLAAKNWSNQIKSYFIVKQGMKEAHFHTFNSSKPWRDESDIVAIVYMMATLDDAENEVPVDTSRPDEENVPYVDTRDSVVQEVIVAEPQTPIVPEPCDTLTEPVAKNDEVFVPMTVEESPAGEPIYVPRMAIKTNAVYWAVAVANLGVEFALGNHYSVDVPVIYSPYTVASDFRFRFLVVQPELRYWLRSPMKGHFFGAHFHAGAFNIAVDDKSRYQSPNGFYGIGLSYGYSLAFARHWAVEFTIGAGYAYTKYDAYYNIPNGARYEKSVPYDYWGITKAGISVVYTFGKQN